MKWNATTSDCACNNDYIINDRGKCTLCQDYKNNTIGNRNRGCMCRSGLTDVGGVCKACSYVNKLYVGNGNGECRCKNGFGNNTGECK